MKCECCKEKEAKQLVAVVKKKLCENCSSLSMLDKKKILEDELSIINFYLHYPAMKENNNANI